jgi:hypothetical protein
MVLTTKEASYIIVLGIVISVLPNSSTFVTLRIFLDEFCDNRSRERTKKAIITLEEATEAYIVDVIAASQHLKQQLISCR